jgi:hypothetical protein
MPTGTYYNVTLEGTDIQIDPSMAGLSGLDLSSITSNMPGQTLTVGDLEAMGITPQDIGLLNVTDWNDYLTSLQRSVDSSTENTSAVEEATKGIREDLGIVKADMKRPTEYNINIDVRTLDAADFETVVKTRIIPELESAISTREFAVAGRTR